MTNINLSELRHNILLGRAMRETTQELLIELLTKQRKKTRKEIVAQVGTKNGEKYQRLKEGNNVVYLDK